MIRSMADHETGRFGATISHAVDGGGAHHADRVRERRGLDAGARRDTIRGVGHPGLDRRGASTPGPAAAHRKPAVGRGRGSLGRAVRLRLCWIHWSRSYRCRCHRIHLSRSTPRFWRSRSRSPSSRHCSSVSCPRSNSRVRQRRSARGCPSAAAAVHRYRNAPVSG